MSYNSRLCGVIDLKKAKARTRRTGVWKSEVYSELGHIVRHLTIAEH